MVLWCVVLWCNYERLWNVVNIGKQHGSVTYVAITAVYNTWFAMNYYGIVFILELVWSRTPSLNEKLTPTPSLRLTKQIISTVVSGVFLGIPLYEPQTKKGK